MKKLACLLLMIALLVPALAMAEDVSLTTYTNPNNGYSIGYPEGWTLLDKETIDDIMSQVMDGKISGMDVSSIQGMKDQIESLDMMLCMSPDGAINYNVVYADVGLEVTNNQIRQMVMPATQEQLSQVFPDMQTVDAGSDEEVGGVNYVTATYTYSISDMDMILTQLVAAEGTMLYTISFTFNTSLIDDFDAMEPTLDAIAGSFVPANAPI